MEDCDMAIRLDPNFAKSYKRLFKSHLALGHIKDARQALNRAMEKEPNDQLNKIDSKLMEDAEYNERMIEKF
jgi:tetratricopeptide (TPR) repeat protein